MNHLPRLLRPFIGTLLVVAFVLAADLAGQTAQPQAPATLKAPVAETHPVADSYHGIKIVDDYRWLENWDDPAVRQWSAAQNARTREYLDALPARPAIKQRLEQLIG